MYYENSHGFFFVYEVYVYHNIINESQTILHFDDNLHLYTIVFLMNQKLHFSIINFSYVLYYS